MNILIAHISNDGKNREETLAEHTEKTEQLCKTKGKRCGILHIMSLCARFHDIGKAKQAFSDYLHSDGETMRKLRGTIAHASTGAKYIYDRYHDTTNVDKQIFVELIAYAIAAHHGLFDCVSQEGEDKFSKRVKQVEDYEEACKNAEEDFLKDYNLDENFEKAYQEFLIILQKISSLIKKPENADKEIFFYLSCLERLIVSILIDSDWEATSYFMNQEMDTQRETEDKKEIFEKSAQHFDIYMQNLSKEYFKTEKTEKENIIYNTRNELQKECKDFARYPSGVYCLPLPTGGGKTLSGLAYALEYCNQHPQTERVIYVSPFISVTEQNAEIFRNAIGNPDWILEHHSSVVHAVENNSEDYEADRVSRIDINWEEPFICTTFVQFMNTLFSDKKQSLRRMHRLVNAVVIIDEVQSMPLKCIDTFSCMMNFLNKVCNTDIILCTATQPKLGMIEYPICYAEPKNMIINVEKRFQQFDRVKIQKEKEKYTFTKLKEEIIEKTSKFSSILVVLNTKSAVRKLYDLLKTESVKIEYLTTNLCPEHRSNKINDIKEILRRNRTTPEKQESIIVVSTNLIEAGVDISFECVYRSLGGLDSIAQTAGRCNRNGEKEFGEMHVIDLEDEHTGMMKDLLAAKQATKEVLYLYDGEDSLLLPKWMNRYYERLFQGNEQKDEMTFPIKQMDTNIYQLLSKGFTLNQSEEYVNYMNQAYRTAGEAYKVIDNASFGVIVPYKNGKMIIEVLQETSDINEIKKYIRLAQRYTVNVNGTQMKKLENYIQPVNEYLQEIYIPIVPNVYHEEYGITGEMEAFIM